MRLIAICTVCPVEVSREDFLVHLDDSGIGFLACSAGHTIAIVPVYHKYELLFESGLLALVDEYSRESVSSIAASFERFLEHFIRVALKAAGLSQDGLVGVWREMGTQSERQLGAFHALHAVLLGKSIGFPNRLSEFRNRVIHKGYVPSLDEAGDFAAEVRTTIFHLALALRKAAPAESREALAHVLAERRAAVPLGVEARLFETLAAFRVKAGDRAAFEKELGFARGIKRAHDRRRLAR